MNYDEEIAKELGVECAILLSNIQFWVKRNMANQEKNHYHDDLWWTYNTAGSFAKLFPYWKERTIYAYLKKLEDNGYIRSGNFNKFKYDRTKWYTLGEKLLIIPIRKKLQMDLPNSANGFAESADAFTEICGPIPDINTNNKPDINTTHDWQTIVLRFYNTISPETSLRFRKGITKNTATHLLTLHSKEDIIKKIDWLKSSNERKFITTFEVFANKYSSLDISFVDD